MTEKIWKEAREKNTYYTGEMKIRIAETFHPKPCKQGVTHFRVDKKNKTKKNPKPKPKPKHTTNVSVEFYDE